MSRHVLIAAAIACALAAASPRALAQKFYLVKTTDNGMSFHLSNVERRNLGQDFGKGTTVLCREHHLRRHQSGSTDIEVGGTVWGCKILKTFNSQQACANWISGGGKADHNVAGIVLIQRERTRTSTRSGPQTREADDTVPSDEEVVHDLKTIYVILTEHRDKLSQEAIAAINQVFTDLLNDDKSPIDPKDIPTAAGGVLAVAGTLAVIRALLAMAGHSVPTTTPVTGGGDAPAPAPAPSPPQATNPQTVPAEGEVIDATVHHDHDEEGSTIEDIYRNFEEGLRRKFPERPM